MFQNVDAENRAIRMLNLSFCFQEIERGEWSLTWEGMAFADKEDDYVLLDGQHRLVAFIMYCNKLMNIQGVAMADLPTLRTVVYTGWPLESRKKAGRGSPRTQIDQFNITRKAGELKLDNRTYNLARQWLVSENKWKSAKLIPDAMLEDFITENYDLIHEVAYAFRKNIQGLKNIGIYVAVAKYMKYNPTRGRKIINMLVDGSDMVGRDHPILRLRNDAIRVIRGKGGDGGVDSMKKFYMKALYCIDRYHYNTPIKMIKPSTLEEVDWEQYREDASGRTTPEKIKNTRSKANPESNATAITVKSAKSGYGKVDGSTKSVTQIEKGELAALAAASTDTGRDPNQADWLELFVGEEK